LLNDPKAPGAQRSAVDAGVLAGDQGLL